jgi:hypothetical protein
MRHCGLLASLSSIRLAQKYLVSPKHWLILFTAVSVFKIIEIKLTSRAYNLLIA